ncbi:MAG: metal-dependent hydrolase [Ardenticatenaceae bacterium]|nr:metal-dependent hydrolase [Anaerolineales bacterium]MCB8921845.1 metal-dependent hydrolase [Ardenticatenaceae bacterium]MCB8990997.1 metal-dependent hydrolase [Ardenticatenaceae bacterium]MCB9005323.1 metal-dependent hydrolase [Ardenticatenaceae bacterium]
MQTYSHFLLTKVLQVRLKKRDASGTTLLLGSVLPDLPLFLLTIGYMVNRRWLNPAPAEGAFDAAYDMLYFNNPWWISLHSLLHAPLLILLYAGIGVVALRQGKRWGRPLLWFAIGCGLHSLIDIFTHVNDGPLLFFPLNWTYRFPAPVSYWDRRYGAQIFAPIEHAIDALILLWLGVRYFRKRRKASHAL